VRWLATSVLGMVIVQGVLGGLRVVWVNLDLAIVHACVAQAFFCLAASVAVITSRRWIEATDESRATVGERGRRLTTLAAACVFAVFCQLVLGALMRHEKAGLAIPDLPLAYGQLLPPTSAPGLDAINQQRAWNYQLDPVSLSQVWLHMSHRIGAIVVSTMLSALITISLTRFRANRWLLRPTLAVIALLLAQLTLGVLTVLMRKPADIASLHVATGALLLATTVVLTVRATRCYSRAFRSDRATSSVEPQVGMGLVTA
jgi:cytochrome c oxidase assembly protein subunit 15